MAHRKKHAAMSIPKEGTFYVLDGLRYDVVRVNKYTVDDRFVCDCLVKSKDVQLTITLSSKFPFKTDDEHG